MVQKAAWKLDQGMPCGTEANMAKWLAAEAGFYAADAAMQTHGGLAMLGSITLNGTGGRPV